jgi:xanthine dehydrogenase/oxidase
MTPKTPAPSDSEAAPSDDLRFYLNGDEVVIRDVDPTMLLLDWLRSPEVGLTGTKKVCAQGGCGACTVMVAEWAQGGDGDRDSDGDRDGGSDRDGDGDGHPDTSAAAGRPRFRSVNACLRPLCTLDGKAVTTTEGTGSSLSKLSPVQYRIAKDDGSQCGFCTPGFVMNMHAFLTERAARGSGKPSQRQIEGIFDGNLCRCTGYRPILYGMKHFAAEFGPQQEKGCLHTVIDPADWVPHTTSVTPEFPPALAHPPRAVHYRRGAYHYYRPLTLEAVHAIQRRHRGPGQPANVKLLVGNTSTGVYDRFVEDPHVLIDVSQVPELLGIAARDDGLYIGAAATYSELLDELERLLAATPGARRAGLEALHYMVRHTAGTIVRNAASVAGNTMMVVRHIHAGEPFPSDAFTAYCALGARVRVSMSGATVIAELPILEFAAEYQRSPALRDDGVVVGFVIPWTRDRQYARTFKVALRPENAHSIVNAGICVQLGDSGTIEHARIVFGGIGPVAFHATTAQECLQHRAWNEATLRETIVRIRHDVEANLARFAGRMAQLPYEGFSAPYKIALAEGLFYQFFVHVAEQLGHDVPPSVRSAGQRPERPVSGGHQAYEKYKGEYPVNLPYIKLDAFLQATGEARYTHDLALPPRGLAAAAVTSTRALANLAYRIPDGDGWRSASVAELCAYLRASEPGFVDLVTAADIPAGGSNVMGPGNDTLFADGQVTTFGQCIGLVLAEREQLAIDLAQRIAGQLIAYSPVVDAGGQPEEPILTIDEARRKGSIFADSTTGYPVHIWKIRRPGTELAWVGGDRAVVRGVACRVVSGQARTGAQLHFYMETQAAVAVPGERNRITVHSSTQSPDSVQSAIRQTLAIPMNHVGVEISRVGGGYGGKTTRSPFVATAAAVAAWKHRRPVKLAMRRENDSAMIGHRHPVYGEYTIAIGTGEDNPDHRGRLMGQSTEFWSDGGNTYDCSFVVMDCIQLRCDGAYYIPEYQTSGDVCRTNKASNGAMRSMGLIQGLLIQEDAVERAAHAIGMLAEDVREKNLYQLGALTPYGQVLDYCYLDAVWARMKKISSFAARLDAVRAYNAANRWTKRGISMIPVKYGSGYNAPFLEQAGALVEIYGQDGTVLVQQGGVEIGQGLQVKVAQVVAKELNVPIALIEIAATDTRVVPNPVSTGASTGSGFNAAAAQQACRRLRHRLNDYCLGLLDEHGPAWCTAKGIDFWSYPEGWRALVGPAGQQKLMWNTIIEMAQADRVNLSAQVRFQQQGGTTLDTGLHFKPEVVAAGAQEAVYQFTGYTYSAACTEVEIDVLTGATTVLRADVLYDMGKSLNPAIDIGQVEGAYIQGLGYVLSEDVVIQPDGPNQGALNADNTWRYKIPATTSIPIELNVDLFPRSDAPEVPDNPYDLYSSKEVGEPPLVLAATAFFAVKHAILAARQDRGHDEWFALEAPATVQRVCEACLVTDDDLSLTGERSQ